MEDKIEDKIVNVLDNLDINETDKLLYSNTRMNIDSATMQRIKKSVYKKVGFKRKNIFKKGLIVVAAAIVLLMLSTVTIGVDNVANAFNKLFSFIPGYAIVENNKSIEFVVYEQNLTAENDGAILVIKNAIATKDYINISFQIERKDFDESKMLEEKQKMREVIESGEQFEKPIILLYANGKEYKTGNFSIGGGGKTDSIFAGFQVDPENINSKTTYKLEYKDYNLSLDFKLKAYDSFDSLEEIGPTSSLNDISITAVSNRKDDKLEVDLYPINKTNYKIKSLTKDNDTGYMGKDLSLQSSEGAYKYTVPGSSMGINNKFYFTVPANAKDLLIKIPYLLVESTESKNILLKIPQQGEKLTLNKKVKFKDCTMIINEVEKVKTEDGNGNGALRLNISYENIDKNKVLCKFGLWRINLLGIQQGGGYGSTCDQNGVTKTIDFYLEKGENSKLRLKVENPEYYLIGEYNIKLD